MLIVKNCRGEENVRDEKGMRELWCCIARKLGRRDDLFGRMHVLQGMLDKPSWWHLSKLRRRISETSYS